MTRLLRRLLLLSLWTVWCAFLLWATKPEPWCGEPRLDVHDRTIVVCTSDGQWHDVMELPGPLERPQPEEEGTEI